MLMFSIGTLLPSVYQSSYYQPQCTQLQQQQQFIWLIKAENNKLGDQLAESQRILTQNEQETDRLRQENVSLQRNSQIQGRQGKRKYRKRRNNLEKHIKCNIEGCKARFSSDMAFRNHQRLQHNIRKRQMFPRE